MSGTLSVDDIDDRLIVKLAERAAAHGRSAEAEHREILRQALEGTGPGFDELAAELRRLTRGRHQTPAEVLLRESRNER
jgi:plasmid stability protein